MSRRPDSQTSEPSIVCLHYGGDEYWARSGQRLLDILLDAGLEHRHVCGGQGFCTSCRVEVLDGSAHLSEVSPVERERLGQDAGRLRLACQTTLLGPATIRVPPPAVGRFPPDE